jgi:hypothetical protein
MGALDSLNNLRYLRQVEMISIPESGESSILAREQIISDIQRISKSNLRRIDSVEKYIHFINNHPINDDIELLKLTDAELDELETIYKLILADFTLLQSELLTDTPDLDSSTITADYLFLQLQKASEIDILLDYYDCIVNYFRGQCDDLLGQNPPDEAIFSDLSFRPNRQLIQLIHDITVADRSSESLSRSSDFIPQSDDNDDDIQPNIIDDDDEQHQQGTL